MLSFSESLIKRVRVQGFRSLHDVSVDLDDLTVLVGPNGSGKSAFVDALAFLQEALVASPQQAFRSRGGIDQVRTRTEPNSAIVSVEVSIQSRKPREFSGRYRVRFQAQADA